MSENWGLVEEPSLLGEGSDMRASLSEDSDTSERRPTTPSRCQSLHVHFFQQNGMSQKRAPPQEFPEPRVCLLRLYGHS